MVEVKTCTDTREGSSGRRTKIDHIEHLRTLILRNARKQLPVRTGRDTDDGHHVRAVVFDKLDARVLFLPQLEMSIDRRRDDKVCAVCSQMEGCGGGSTVNEPNTRVLRSEATHRVTTTKLITSRCMKLL